MFNNHVVQIINLIPFIPLLIELRKQDGVTFSRKVKSDMKENFKKKTFF